MKVGANARILLQSCGWSDLLSCSVHPTRWRRGNLQECLNSTARGYTMPAFSFEKISPPARTAATTPAKKKQRGMIVQILDRFVEARGKRALKSGRPASAKSKPKP